ncbi:MAG: hypothetical protein AAF297_11830, partial [Planctomycetota bacterium]
PRAYRGVMNALEKLRSVVDEIKAQADPLALTSQWALAGRLLQRFPVDQTEAARIVHAMEVASLDDMVNTLEHPTEAAKPKDVPTFEKAELDHALKAFRKRLKLGRLADESKLGGRYTSGGKQSKIDAIEPPGGFPVGIWHALVQAGRLRNAGGGFFSEP